MTQLDTFQSIKPDRPCPLVLAVDGNSLYHRAYHGYKASDMRDADGNPTWALYGFGALLAGICDKTSPDALIVAFDDPDGSVRKERYPAYKDGRSDKDDELIEQIAKLPALLEAMGVTVVVRAGHEADDVVAAVAKTAADGGWRCLIATSDRDSFGLITDQVAVLRLKSGLDNAEFLNPAALVEQYGIRPDQYLDFAALRGDKSDNLPGVSGIGEKRACKLLEEFDSVEDAIADPERAAKVLGKATAAKLIDNADVFRFNREMMAPVDTLDVPVNESVLPLNDVRVVEALHAAGLPGLADRLAEELGYVKLTAEADAA